MRGSQRAEVVAIASRDADRARAFASEFSIPRVHASYTHLLDDPDVDAVYIALPNSLHEVWTVSAARAGKHVLCEKPVSASAVGAQRMADACRVAGVVFMEAFMWRHHPQQQRVHHLLRDGAIGAPTVLRSSFTFVVSDPANVRLQQDLEGGSLMDVGCYGVNAARWLFEGEPEFALGQQALDPAYGVDTSFAAILRFSDDRLAIIDSSFTTAARNMYSIEGPQGRIQVERAFRPDADPGRVTLIRPGESEIVEEIPAANQFSLEIDHFAASVEAGRLLAPAEDGVAQARVVEALYASARTNETIALA
jgi:D-xylose 1-dehydrogenase (NADP+, D-xylono-1,5-lactone-forming)